MPFFMAVSGMTMALSIGRANNKSEYIKKKAKRLLVPFLTVTIFLSIPLKYFSGYWNNSENMISDMFLGQVLLMGNSHLWFIVSLFIISIVFYFLHLRDIDKGFLYWLFVIAFSLAGKYIESKNNIFGIGAAMKYYLFFALGYKYYEKLKIINPGFIITFLSWIGMFVAYILHGKIILMAPLFTYLSYYFIAIWGCFNMIALAKLLVKIPILINNRLFKSFNKRSYELYLYSDPFNYLLIMIFSAWMGYGYVTDNLNSIIAYLSRIALSIIFAYVVIWIVSLPSKWQRRSI